MNSFFETELNKVHDLPDGYWFYVALSTAFWTALYSVSSYFLPQYELMKSSSSKSELKDLKSRVISSIHALFSCGNSLYFLLNDETFKELSILHSNDTFCLTTAPSLGYFIYDYFLIMTDYESLGGLGMFAHHICVVACLLGTTYYRIYHIVVLLFCFSEITTPFVNARIILLKMGMKDSKLYVINGICMFLGFLFFRFSLVFIIPYIILSQMDKIKQLSGLTNLLSFVSYMAMSFLNSMWTYKIFIGLLKAIRPSSAVEPQTQQQYHHHQHQQQHKAIKSV